MKLVFWHNIISPHQSPVVRELANAGHDVLLVTFEDMSEDRRQLGWDIPLLAPARILLCPKLSQVDNIVRESPPDAIHIIAGARAVPLGAKVAISCHTIGRRMGIITESPDPRGLGGLLRRLKYGWERLYIGGHFDFILAMGQQGVEWFRLCGYPSELIFPYSYVTEPQPVSPAQEAHRRFRFIFVGRLVHLKGLDILLKALKNIPDVELLVIGDGPERKSLEDLAAKCKIVSQIRWMGQMQNKQTLAYLADADVLVLPSRKDGWGAVVNEALMAGIPVICSSACGASDLICHSWLGTVFPANHEVSLKEALLAWSQKGVMNAEQKQKVKRWAQCIEGRAIARYLEEILAHVYEDKSRPEVPWRE
ncbi:glycosyltransferase family 4 protein [Methylovulum psychrotolerans]|uniref:Glycosyltransferase family 4 protein n=1 Tax=Methylovulum psychrotolerans TaxID=1704499 RepID=A0A2S5CMX5_9GAMM|nr:glycosyltransferase [Methylovulum psychrotolerans]POZ52107.1 glycosyltransferase family 4 protein [Methylovulum psychrotolerans]